MFPPISAILGAFLTICFQPFGVLLFLAHCSGAPAVITSRRPHGQPGSTFQLAAVRAKLLSDGKTQWWKGGGAEDSLLQAETPLMRVLMSGQGGHDGTRWEGEG